MSPNPFVKPNYLKGFHDQFVNLTVAFREEVCNECNWSVPTFYRKMRAVDHPSFNNRNKVIPAISNAEKDKIIQISDKVLLEMWKYLEHIRKGRENNGKK
jgi:hypothetical protein